MGFLDRFKPQPKWKHTDSAVRAAAVEALPEEEQDTLRSIALEDPDPAVRRTALGRLSDVSILASIARDDPDETVRNDARELVVGIARDSTRADEAMAALSGLADSRELAIVARGAEQEDVARAALDRLVEDRIVAVVARQASHAAVRHEALRRLSAAEDLLGVAVKSEHKDVAVAALDRLTEREHLELVATRARNKAVSRRARAQLRALEEAERVPRQQAARRLQLCELVEGLMHAPNLTKAEEVLSAAAAEWQELSSGADEAQAARFDAAVGRFGELLATSEAERAEHERRAQVLADEVAQAAASRIALCEKVEGLDEEEAALKLDEARTIWVALMSWPEAAREGPQARALDDRFARACGDCERRISRRAEMAIRKDQLDHLLGEAEQATALPDSGAARSAFALVRHAWQAAVAEGLVDAPRAERFRALEAVVAQRDTETREARARQAMENLARLEQLAHRIEGLVAAPELTLRDAERAIRDTRAAADYPGPLPTRQDHDRLVHRFKEAHAALFPRLQELREAEDWRRWANAGVQEELCRRAEALKDVENSADAARQLRDLQQEWKKVGSAPRERADALWRRFKTACDETRARLDGFFATQREGELASLRAKVELCERAEALIDSTDWIRTAEQLKQLQAEWQKIGPVPHDQAKAVWTRFRSACDRFFTRRKEDLAQRKKMWAENLVKKEAICARVEELAGSTSWEATAAEIKRLQAEWRSIGPVKPSRSEAIWQRFRSACDAFFERFKHRDQLALSDSMSAREGVCREIEALAAGTSPRVEAAVGVTEGTSPASAEPGPAAAARGDTQRAILDLWQRWQQSPRLPWSLAEPLEKRFEAALLKLVAATPAAFKGTRLDVEANVRRMEELCLQVENLVAGRLSATDIASAPPEALATLLKDALAANTIGGKADEEAKRRSAATAVKDAQAAWRRLGPVPGERGRQLGARFHRACRRFFDQRTPGPTGHGTREAHVGVGASVDRRQS